MACVNFPQDPKHAIVHILNEHTSDSGKDIIALKKKLQFQIN